MREDCEDGFFWGWLHEERNALQRRRRLGRITETESSRLEDILAEIDWLDRQRVARHAADPVAIKLVDITARLVALQAQLETKR